jgi:hypothetical protein
LIAGRLREFYTCSMSLTNPDPPSTPGAASIDPHASAPDTAVLVTPARAVNIAYLSEVAGITMEQIRACHLIVMEALAAPPGSQVPHTLDPVLSFHRMASTLTRVLKVKDGMEQSVAEFGRTPLDKQRDIARALRRRREACRHDIRVKIDQTLTNIRNSESRFIRRDIEEWLANEANDDMLETQTTAEIVLTICEELAIAPDLSKWSDADIGFVPPPPTPHRSTMNWIPEVNAAGFTTYFAGPSHPADPDADPIVKLYGFDDDAPEPETPAHPETPA